MFGRNLCFQKKISLLMCSFDLMEYFFANQMRAFQNWLSLKTLSQFCKLNVFSCSVFGYHISVTRHG